MPANTAPIFELTPNVKGVQFTTTDTTAKKTIFTAGANGARVDSIMVSSNDTAQVNLQFYLNDGTTDYYLGVVPVPISAGYGVVSRVDAMLLLGEYVIGVLILPSTYTLKAACLATMTAAKVMDVVVWGGDF